MHAVTGRTGVLVVAHPDDEVLGAGELLQTGVIGRIVMLTDGAPEDAADAGRAGFASNLAYADARRREAAVALDRLGAVHVTIVHAGLVDQRVVESIEIACATVAHAARDAAFLLTHAYEGGHPDHDAAALVCRLVVDAAGRRGRDVPLFEFAGYFAGESGLGLGDFCDGGPSFVASWDATWARKRAALDAFETQRSVIAALGCWRDRWREAPRYDFGAPPPAPRVLYDAYDWPLKSAMWRARVQAGLCETRGAAWAAF